MCHVDFHIRGTILVLFGVCIRHTQLLGCLTAPSPDKLVKRRLMKGRALAGNRVGNPSHQRVCTVSDEPTVQADSQCSSPYCANKHNKLSPFSTRIIVGLALGLAPVVISRMRGHTSPIPLRNLYCRPQKNVTHPNVSHHVRVSSVCSVRKIT